MDRRELFPTPRHDKPPKRHHLCRGESPHPQAEAPLISIFMRVEWCLLWGHNRPILLREDLYGGNVPADAPGADNSRTAASGDFEHLCMAAGWGSTPLEQGRPGLPYPHLWTQVDWQEWSNRMATQKSRLDPTGFFLVGSCKRKSLRSKTTVP